MSSQLEGALYINLHNASMNEFLRYSVSQLAVYSEHQLLQILNEFWTIWEVPKSRPIQYNELILSHSVYQNFLIIELMFPPTNYILSFIV